MDEKTARTELEQNDITAEAVETPAAAPAEVPADIADAPAPVQAVEDEAAEAAADEAPAATEDGEDVSPDAPEADGAPSETAEEGEASDEESPLPEDAEGQDDADAPLVLGTEGAEEAAPARPAAPAFVPPAPGIAARLFNGLSYVGLPALIVFAAAMSFLEVWFVRDLCSCEARLADVFAGLKAGDWIALTLNGQPYPDTPPLFFWLMEALTRIPGVHVAAPMVFFLAAALSHVMFIAAVWMLARGTGHDRREAFAAGLVALSCVFISGVAACPGEDLLFSAITALGMTCLYRGWIKGFAPFWLAAGFLLMALATFTKGPQGIAFAIATSVLFLFWRGTPGRLNSRDGIPGFFLMLAGIGAWLGWLYLEGHTDLLRAMLMDQLSGHVLEGGNHAKVWWYYLAALPVVWLPFTILILFVDWFGVLRGVPGVWKTRKTNGGSSWLWIWLVTGVALLTCVQAKSAVYALPLLAPLAVLTGRSLMRLTPGRSRCFFCFTAALLALCGLGLVLFDVYPALRGYIPAGIVPALPEGIVPAGMVDTFFQWMDALDGTMYMGGILVLLAVALLFFTRLVLPGGALLVMAFGMMAMFQPFHYFVAPTAASLFPATAKVEAAPKTEAPAAPEAAPAEAPAPQTEAPAEAAPAEAPAAEASAPAEKI